MAITSSTTAVAFFANSFSPLLSISAFGIFAGVIVPINYFLVVMIFPPAVIWYEDNILNNEKLKKCICWRRITKSKQETTD
jgi:predicted RND superfamily exporter protein